MSEKVRDVAEQYVETFVVSLALHYFVKLTEVNPEFVELPKIDILVNLSNYMLEVYVDYCTALATPSIRYQLHHVSNALMSGIHDVFLP